MTKPTIRDLLDTSNTRKPNAYGRYLVLTERVEAVLRLHAKEKAVCSCGCDARNPRCTGGGCPGGVPWPCPTIRALEGE